MQNQNQCIKELPNEQVLNKVVETYPHVVLFIKDKQNGQSNQIQNHIENQCRSFGSQSPVPVVSCDVEHKFCQDKLKQMQQDNPDGKIYFPMLSGLNKERSFSNPIWKIVGGDTEKIDMIFGKLRNLISQQGPSNNAPQTPQAPQSPQTSQYEQNLIQQAMPRRKVSSFHSQSHSPKSKICFPPHCSSQSSKRSIIDFVLY